MLNNPLKKPGLLVKMVLIGLIKIYQKIFSFDQGIMAIGFSACRFRPTCSQYMIDAIEGRGAIKGIFLGLKRLLRCHPFSQGGWDPVDQSAYSHICKSGCPLRH